MTTLHGIAGLEAASAWYNPVEFEHTVARPLVVGTADLRGVAPAALRRGQRLDTWDPAAWVQARTPAHDGQPDDVLQEHLGLPIYSPRLRSALNGAGIAGIQYLPVEVRASDGTPEAVFFIANVLNVVAALDLERSGVTRFGDDRPDRKGEIRSVQRAVLRRAAVEGYDVLRLAEYRAFLCLSERFRQTFEAAHCTGYGFQPLQVD